MTTPEARKLATGVIECAVRDCKGRVAGDLIASLAWLASRQASIWFDILGLDQAAFLESLGWREMALEVMLDPPKPLSWDEFDTIADSLDYFEAHRPPSPPVTV